MIYKRKNFEERKMSLGKIMEETPEKHILNQMYNTVAAHLKDGHSTDTIPKFKNLYELISSKNLMRISHKILLKNDSARLSGSNNESIQGFSEQKIEELHQSLINKTFKWSLNKDTRPLEKLNFSERIIQYNIYLVLESIYEPIFEKTNKNFGFRINKSYYDSIRAIANYKNQGLNMAIQGYIEGALDSIHFPILCKILRERIEDKDFINLIYKACTILTVTKIKNKQKSVELSKLGAPQADMMSSTLFNIYMQKFDEFIIDIQDKIYNTNIISNRKTYILNKYYLNTRELIYRIQNEIKNVENTEKIYKLNPKQKFRLRKLKKLAFKITLRRTRLNVLDREKAKSRIFYNRYAKDFILLINQDMKFCMNLKSQIIGFLDKKLKLTLSEQKIKITNIQYKPAKYLGFVITITKKQVHGRKNVEIQDSKLIQIGPDLNHLLSILIDTGLATEKACKPKSAKSLAMFKPHEIIDIYNSKMQGIFNYYYPLIVYKSILARIWYILYYSCIHTLAHHHKTTVRKIFSGSYGWTEINSNKQKTNRVRIVAVEKTMLNSETIKTKYKMLHTWTDICDIAYALNENRKNKSQFLQKIKYQDLFFKFQTINWRAPLNTGSIEFYPSLKIIVNHKKRSQKISKPSKIPYTQILK